MSPQKREGITGEVGAKTGKNMGIEITGSVLKRREVINDAEGYDEAE